jgi:hypothetical protein
MMPPSRSWTDDFRPLGSLNRARGFRGKIRNNPLTGGELFSVPPHLIPLTEIVGGAKTSEATIRRAAEFYTSIGQRTVRVNKEAIASAAFARRTPVADMAITAIRT